MNATGSRLLVDAFNVIGSRPDGWWRDRDGAVRALVARLQRLVADERDERVEGVEGGAGTSLEVTVAVDGLPIPGLAEGMHEGVAVVYAAGGRNAADDRIVALVRADREPGTLEVVTSDRALRARVEAAGGRTRGPRWLIERLDARP